MKRWMMLGIIVATLLIISSIYAGKLSRRTHHRVHHTHQSPTHNSVVIAGRVEDAEGRPISRARVTAQRENVEKQVLPTTYTDHDGKFIFQDLNQGIYTIYAAKEAEGYAPTYSEFYSSRMEIVPQVNILSEQKGADIVVRLGQKSGRLIGQIVDAETNTPIENSKITLHRMNNQINSVFTSSDPNGNFNILAPPIPIMVEISAPGYENKRLNTMQLKAGEIKQLKISLRPQ